MRNLLVLPVSFVMFGCKPPPEAPTEVNDLSLYLFANFDNEDEEVVAVGLQNLATFLAAEDLSANINDRSATLGTLEGTNLGTVVPPEGADPALQTNVGVWGTSVHDLATHKELVTVPNQVCAAGGSTRYSMRSFTTDTACWEDGSCRELSTTSENRTESIADVWLDVNSDFRMILIDDGRDVLISRGYMPRQYASDNGDVTWDQRYTLDIWLGADAEGAAPTARYYAMWSSVTGLPANIYANAVKSGVDEYYVNTDEWITADMADEACHTDPSRAYDRPTE